MFIYFKYLSRNKKNLKPNKNKSEPTINKNSLITRKEIPISKTKNQRVSEVDQFKFSLPELSYLIKSTLRTGKAKEIDKMNFELANKLQQTLSEYGVEGKIEGYKTGPIVTLFEFIPNAGIKSSKVIGLSEDIARAMSSLSARIASQPGKTSLGIEIPNSKREGVLFGDLIEDERYMNDNQALTLALGKDISGEKIFTDLEKMPHLLIAGTTGSGKSVGINTMILSLLFKFKPNECKLILIDPKMLELSIYEDIPHLLTPVVTDPKKAVFALKWVVREMENRYKLMSSVNVKNIASYNLKVEKNISTGKKLFREVQTGIDPDTKIPIIEKKEIILEKMPFIVVVIDEMADLMMVAGKEVESLVQRLAQMARASGIHLITATQRPSVDVITGTIKANFPSRISYKVASKFDSRTILNEMGAEQLLGSGDMLFLENGGNIKRLHGGFVSESEVEKVVTSIKRQATFDYRKEISLNDDDGLKNNGLDLVSDNYDELYSQAVEIVVKQQKVSTSYIQRYLQIGYNRAARIVEKMEEDGIISEASNAGKRHVLKKE
ncbi:DNA translocase FtsK [Pelagibacteraceae bacterium]|nr:DNA translocase FtsK [Pelagibacteraceae bacterium]